MFNLAICLNRKGIPSLLKKLPPLFKSKPPAFPTKTRQQHKRSNMKACPRPLRQSFSSKTKEISLQSDYTSKTQRVSFLWATISMKRKKRPTPRCGASSTFYSRCIVPRSVINNVNPCVTGNIFVTPIYLRGREELPEMEYNPFQRRHS